jgi:hypothetical protein
VFPVGEVDEGEPELMLLSEVELPLLIVERPVLVEPCVELVPPFPMVAVP